MARLRLLVRLTALAAVALTLMGVTRTNAGVTTQASVTLETSVSGSTAWSHLDEHIRSVTGGRYDRHIPTRAGSTAPNCGLWSSWHLSSINGATGSRRYGIYVYDGCDDDAQVFPPGPNACNPDDSAHASGRFSYCVTLPPRTLVVGLAPQSCNAQAVVATSLNAGVTPVTYDSTRATPLTVTTSFGPNFVDRLSEGFCTDVLDWQVLGWTIRWPDGAEDTLPGTGQQGTTATHTLAPSPGAGATPQRVVAIAHLHIHGQALDFDDNAQIVPVTRDALVEVSNDAALVGAGVAPAYTPPRLQAGAVPVSQLGDGTMPALDPAAPAAVHVATIRGRLLALYPRPIIVSPGTESVGDVLVGQAVTTTTGWRYAGDLTDAPLREATAPGATGTPLQPVQLQYNHAEQLDVRGDAVDESVPLQVSAHTVYPDGHAEDVTITGSVGVSIYYPALFSPA